jgi:hypothetical protein
VGSRVRRAGDPAFEDMATSRAIVVTREQWRRDWLASAEAMFVALADE